MRTTRRYSLVVNKEKWAELKELARLYRDEKNFHLNYYNIDQKYIQDKSNIDQQMRNVRSGFVSPNKLQARQWKICQKDAYQTVDKNWKAFIVEIKHMVSRQKSKWTDSEMHYAYWLCSNAKRLASLHDGLAPIPNQFKVSYEERKRVQNYLRRVVRRKRGLRPVAKLSRSLILDSDMYSVVEKIGMYGKKTQFIKIMGLKPRKQIVIPLTGYSNFSGNIRVILDFQKHRIEAHTTSDLIEPQVPATGAIIALDAGISEVFMDENGKSYEPTFGQTLTNASEQLSKTGKVRNKLHALHKKSSKHKAHRIRKFNLGKKKMKERKRKGQLRVKQQISQAIHQVVKEHKPAIIVTERLDIRGKAKSKKMSRLVSYWMRSALKERLEFLALVEGFHHKQVNPAYTSQMCPTCLFVHKGNRAGDIFKCLNCGHTDHADRIAAINLRARYEDPEITVYTPKTVVRSILHSRFIADFERRGNVAILTTPSVPGRTDMQSKVCQSETPLLNPNIVNEHGIEMSHLMIF